MLFCPIRRCQQHAFFWATNPGEEVLHLEAINFFLGQSSGMFEVLTTGKRAALTRRSMTAGSLGVLAFRPADADIRHDPSVVEPLLSQFGVVFLG